LLLIVDPTVKFTPLLAVPPTVTTTLPVVAPAGTAATMLVALQFVGVADVPLKLRVLVPRDMPKFVPVIVTEVPTGPDVGVRLAMLGAKPEADVTVNPIPLLATPPTVTTTFPVVTPAGTAATMLVALQLVGVAAVPLKLTVLLPGDTPKFAPVIVTEVPTGPEFGLRLVILGAEPEAEVTVNATPLLATPPTVTTTFPVVAPAGTTTTMLVALQFVGVAAVPLKVSVLLPCDAPKFVPVIVTDVPATPEAGFRLAIFGTKDVEPAWPPLEQPVFSSAKFKASNNRTTLARGDSEFPLESRNGIVTIPPSISECNFVRPKPHGLLQ
jgi:hypothetical protein